MSNRYSDEPTYDAIFTCECGKVFYDIQNNGYTVTCICGNTDLKESPLD